MATPPHTTRTKELGFDNAAGLACAGQHQAIDEFTAKTTLPFPGCLSDTLMFPLASFYVRPCFTDYYDYITTAFDTSRIRGVTVAGTPGVGTSVFLAYFLLRYRLQHPTATVVLLTYDDDSVMGRVRVWESGAACKDLVWPQVGFGEDQFKDDPNVIFFVDGPPNRAPMTKHPYVVFTRQQKWWAKKTAKIVTHRTIYMPLWDVAELTTAVRALGLDNALLEMDDIPDFPRPVGATEVAYRFGVFGGVARPCLVINVDYVNKQVAVLQEAAASLDLSTGYCPRLEGHSCGKVCDVLFHCYPSSDRFSSRLKTASPYVMQLLTARVARIEGERRVEYELEAAFSRAGGVLRQAMIATRVRTLLESGTELVARSVGHEAQVLTLKIQPSVPKAPTIPLGLSCSEAHDGGLWLAPQVDGFESVVGVYLIQKQEQERGCVSSCDVEAIVFLAAGSFNDEVPGRHVYALLKFLGLKDTAPQRVALVFAVPEIVADVRRKRRIATSCAVGYDFPLTAVNGLTTEMTTILKAARIQTVHDLRRLPDGAKLNGDQVRAYEKAQALLCKQENEVVVSGSASHKMLQQIPQFVWGVKEE